MIIIDLKSHTHDDVIKWKHFPHYWPFVWGIHWSPVNSRHRGQWRGPLMFSLICVWINGWVNNREAGDLRRYRAHFDVIVMLSTHLFVIYLALSWVKSLIHRYSNYIFRYQYPAIFELSGTYISRLGWDHVRCQWLSGQIHDMPNTIMDVQHLCLHVYDTHIAWFWFLLMLQLIYHLFFILDMIDKEYTCICIKHKWICINHRHYFISLNRNPNSSAIYYTNRPSGQQD